MALRDSRVLEAIKGAAPSGWKGGMASAARGETGVACDSSISSRFLHARSQQEHQVSPSKSLSVP